MSVRVHISGSPLCEKRFGILAGLGSEKVKESHRWSTIHPKPTYNSSEHLHRNLATCDFERINIDMVKCESRHASGDPAGAGPLVRNLSPHLFLFSWWGGRLGRRCRRRRRCRSGCRWRWCAEPGPGSSPCCWEASWRNSSQSPWGPNHPHHCGNRVWKWS